MDQTSSRRRTAAQTDREGVQPIGAVWPGQPYPRGATWDGEGVNFSLFSAGLMQRLITQMYFPDEPLNDIDPILNGVDDLAARASLIARQLPDAADGSNVFTFDIVLLT